MYRIFAICLFLSSGAVWAQAPATDAERAEVMIAVDDYLRARESGDLDTAYGMMGFELKAEIDLDRYRRSETTRRAHMGPLERFTPLRAMRYDEIPQRFVLDYLAFYANDLAECGYLVWINEDEKLTLSRIVSGALEADLVGTDKGATLMRDLGCVAIPEARP